MLEFEITFTDDATPRLQRIKTANFDKPLRKSCVYMEQITRVRFGKEIDPDGKRWEPLAPATLAQKKSGSILREHGVLVNATYSRIQGNTGYIENATFYGIFHQKPKTPRMPQRKFLGFSNPDVRKINDIFRKFVEEL